MRHYEIILLIKPDSDQVRDMIERYTQFIQSKSGVVHHEENLGREPIYPIKNITKAFFVRINIECEPSVQEELNNKFLLNDEILRSTITKRPDSKINPITFMQSKEPEVQQRKSFSSSSTTAAANVETAQHAQTETK